MDDCDRDCPPRRSSSGLGLFWIGAGIGFFLSALAVASAVEFTRRRYAKLQAPDYTPERDDLLEDITAAVEGGLFTLAEAVTHIGHSFSEARREVVRFGLDPAQTSSGSTYAWYNVDDEDGQPERP
jgi:hypothetical protein